MSLATIAFVLALAVAAYSISRFSRFTRSGSRCLATTTSSLIAL
jgi:hypothetical protein